MRLDKYLCEAGLGTRSQVKKLLKSGVVTINGRTARKPEEKIEKSDTVAVSGKELSVSEQEYWMLHKPSGYVSATEDKRFPTVIELLPEEARKDLFPVGRLDRDTEGLLLLVNDGELAHRLLSPKHHAEKTYYVRVEGRLTEETVRAFEEGMDIGEKKKTLPAKLSILDSGEISEAEVTLYEGKFHQVKRMFAACGLKVLYLKRISMAGILLDPSLEPGQWRALTPEECLRLKER